MPGRSPTPSPSASPKERTYTWYTTASRHHGRLGSFKGTPRILPHRFVCGSPRLPPLRSADESVCSSAERAGVDGDPHVLGGGDDAVVGVVQRRGGVDLATLAAAEVPDDDVLLAHQRERVDAGRH